MTIFDVFIKKLEELCLNSGIDDTHGVVHALAVMENAERAIFCSNDKILKREIYMIKLAALLHDADDTKYFIFNDGYCTNAREILKCDPCLTDIEIETIIKMINLVSTSKNKDDVPNDCPLWMLIPRYADRLESIGINGIERTLNFSIIKNQPLFLETTLKAKTLDELGAIATYKRYEKYTSNSVSMFDHIYDKLLHSGNFPIRNKYFDYECKKRMKPIYDLALEFGKSKDGMTVKQLQDFIKINKK
jgi:hypothetical protein